MGARGVPRAIGMLVLVVAPSRIKRLVYRRFFGWDIGEDVSIGLCVITAKNVQLGHAARIGNFTVIRNLPSLVLEDHASIGSWNWITCGSFFTSGEASVSPPKEQGLFMGRHSALTSRHYVDCPGGVHIGPFTTVAGVRTTIVTHYVDMETNAQTCKPVRIGGYCYIGSNARFTPGSSVPDACVVGMGAVVVGHLDQPNLLYGGVPARPIRPAGNGEYFRRETGRAR